MVSRRAAKIGSAAMLRMRARIADVYGKRPCARPTSSSDRAVGLPSSTGSLTKSP